MTVIVLTRPEAAGRQFARALRERAVTCAVLFSPVMEIVPLDAGDIGDAVPVFTSVNGVRAAGGAIRNRNVVVVGARTASAARAFGARPEALGGSADALAAALIARGGGTYLHLHGRHVARDLAARLTEAGVRATSRVVYEQRPRALTRAARDALLGERHTVLPLFSARTAALVAKELGLPPRRTTVIALSAGVAQAWQGPGRALIAARPDALAMIDRMAKVVVAGRAD